MGMHGKRGGFMRGRGTPNQRGRGRGHRFGRQSRSRSRSRSYSRYKLLQHLISIHLFNQFWITEKFQCSEIFHSHINIIVTDRFRFKSS